MPTESVDLVPVLGAIESLHYKLRRRSKFTKDEKELIRKLGKHTASLLRIHEKIVSQLGPNA